MTVAGKYAPKAPNVQTTIMRKIEGIGETIGSARFFTLYWPTVFFTAHRLGRP
jgi:hypothetical protein